MSESDNNVKVYIESVNRKQNVTFFDFVDKLSFINFAQEIGRELNVDGPSIIVLRNYTGKNVQEDTFYSMNVKSLRSLATEISIVAIKDSLVLGYEIDLQSSDIILFDKSISPKKLGFINSVAPKDFELPNDFFTGSERGDRIKIVVRNIGQGNWNEINIDGQIRIVFDIGTIIFTKEAELRKSMSERDIIYQKDHPILILSHWDVDHYHFLLAAEDLTIQSFPFFLFRNFIPTNMARKVYERFELLNPNALFPIASFDPYPKRASIELKSYPICQSSNYLLFNSYYNKSRNKNALGLMIRRVNTSVIFPADYDYRQVSNGMIPNMNLPSRHYLIVPHHGGNAGRYVYSVNSKVKLELAVISVGGNNPYNPKHPYEKNMKSLTNSGFKIKRTDLVDNDIEFFIT